jgi:uncharacterized protein YjbI with pentapeptide repeats
MATPEQVHAAVVSHHRQWFAYQARVAGGEVRRERRKAATCTMEPPRTFRELLDRYERGERDFAGSELDEDLNNDLSGVCLDGVDLSRSFIMASFRGASLQRARFIEANVKTCDFRDADLREADFSNATICAAEFSGAKLDGARFAGASTHSYTLKDGEIPDW